MQLSDYTAWLHGNVQLCKMLTPQDAFLCKVPLVHDVVENLPCCDVVSIISTLLGNCRGSSPQEFICAWNGMPSLVSMAEQPEQNRPLKPTVSCGQAKGVRACCELC